MKSIREVFQFDFIKWILTNQETIPLVRLYFIISMVGFVVLKVIYPFPNFMPPDSYSYLDSAFFNDSIAIWPVGYSKFLRIISCLTSSHFFLIFTQYSILQISLLYLLFSIKYFLDINVRLVKFWIVVFSFNPILLQIANFVSSDCIFISLSIIWITQLFWIVFRPNLVILPHILVILFALFVRHNAIYYPLISICGLIFSHSRPKYIICSVMGIGAVVSSMIFVNGYNYRKLTGENQYSAFGGWQIAANSLYGYAHVLNRNSMKLEKFRILDSIVVRHFDSLNNLSVRPDYDVYVYYQWDQKSPLRDYMKYHWRKNNSEEFFRKYASVAPLYSSYGFYIIRTYPSYYLKYFVWPNTVKYFMPPTRFLGNYNLKRDTVEPIAIKWFFWKNNKLWNYRGLEIPESKAASYLFAIFNVFFLLGCIFISVQFRSFGICLFEKKLFALTFTLWVTNFLFSVLSAPIELRYQLFQFILIFLLVTRIVTLVVNKYMQQDKGIALS